MEESLIGVWSNSLVFGADEPEPQTLVFLPDGSGRFERYNLDGKLTAIHTFTWQVRKNRLTLTGQQLQTGSEETAESDLRLANVPFEIVPGYKRQTILSIDHKGKLMRHFLCQRVLPSDYRQPEWEES